MARPSKKELKAAIEKLKSPNSGSDVTPHDTPTPGLSPKKSNKNRIRKQGV